MSAAGVEHLRVPDGHAPISQEGKHGRQLQCGVRLNVQHVHHYSKASQRQVHLVPPSYDVGFSAKPDVRDAHPPPARETFPGLPYLLASRDLRAGEEVIWSYGQQTFEEEQGDKGFKLVTTTDIPEGDPITCYAYPYTWYTKKGSANMIRNMNPPPSRPAASESPAKKNIGKPEKTACSVSAKRPGKLARFLGKRKRSERRVDPSEGETKVRMWLKSGKLAEMSHANVRVVKDGDSAEAPLQAHIPDANCEQACKSSAVLNTRAQGFAVTFVNKGEHSIIWPGPDFFDKKDELEKGGKFKDEQPLDTFDSNSFIAPGVYAQCSHGNHIGQNAQLEYFMPE